MVAASPTELRHALRAAGFNPLPLVGKRPVLRDWQKRTEASAGDIDLWERLYPEAKNSGCLTAHMPSLDIDILDEAAVRAVEDFVTERFEERGFVLVRIGKSPKAAIPFRTNEPFGKIAITLVAANGIEGKLEFLAAGQQIVVAGLHPDTGQPYRWSGGEPGGIKLEDLPYIGEIEARDLVGDLVALLARDFGYRARPSAKAGNGAGGADRGRSEWSDLVAGIITGSNFHDSTVTLAAKLVTAGMDGTAAANLIRALYFNTTAPRDDRWNDRINDVDRAVISFEAKFGPKVQAASGSAPAAGLGVFNGGKIGEKPSPRGWLLGNSFCRCLVSTLVSSGGVGKTALRLAQAMALASGKEITGEHVFERARVLFISLEDDRAEIERRVLAAQLHHGIAASELDGWLFLAAPGASAGKLMAANPRTGALQVGTLAGAIEAAAAEHDIGLVIIDPLVKAHAVNENDNGQMDALAQLLTDMAARLGIGVDIPHHVAKGGAADPGNADRSRGASATANAARLAWTLSAMSPQEAERFGIEADSRRDYVRYDRGKINVARTSGPATWFRIAGVAIGNETERYPYGDNVQTLECWSPPETWEGLDAALLNQILTAIAAGPGGGNFYTAASVARDRAAWEVVQRHAPAKTEAQCREVIRTWIRTGLLVPFDYQSPTTWKTVKGLKVDDARRPG
jgi:hypothetical protein